MTMNPLVRSFHHLGTSTWTHVIADPATRRAAIVDPVLDLDPASGRVSADSARRVFEYLGTTGLVVDWILETHAHADHLSAAAWFQRTLATSAQPPDIGIGAGIVEVQRTFKRLLNLDADFATDASQFDRAFAEGEVFRIGELEMRVIATPGHTPDGVSYLVGDAVFVGDTLFAPRAGSARCDFPGASAVMLYRSIQRLYALPDATRMFVCHDYPGAGEEPVAQTTVGEQKRSNIHIRGDTREDEFVALRVARDTTLPTPALLWHSLQVNIRAGHLPTAESNAVTYLKLPLQVDL